LKLNTYHHEINNVPDLTPREIVGELDRYIIGQDRAKRAVAIALRNRKRRQLVPDELRDEILPKNILMVGATGVGKTEIARRLARLAKAPFTKVEASKFTEVGYVGRDVESMIRDLMEISVNMVKEEESISVREKAELMVEDRILSLYHPPLKPAANLSPEEQEKIDKRHEAHHVKLRQAYRNGALEEMKVETEVDQNNMPMLSFFNGSGMEEIGFQFKEMLPNIFGNKKKKKQMTIAEARKILQSEEEQRLIDMERVQTEALSRVQNSGIIFLDEIDKIAGGSHSRGADVSREGVQRDLLPIIEGSTVNTKYGMVKTDHILFIAAGAFHSSKPSDLMPELQGRFPIQVELDTLTEHDFYRILTEPRNSLVKQYEALLETEEVSLSFTENGLKSIAKFAFEANETRDNIGARRLHTVIENVMDELSYNAPDMAGEKVVIDKEYVSQHLEGHNHRENLKEYIL
jgi:ATP-dependent HslUV protease ATP-binding subunit HslU